MGLLADYLPSLPDDPNQNAAARQGLLAFGAALLGGRGNFGSIMGQGLASGANGYNSTMQALQQKALQDAQTKHYTLANDADQAALDQNRAISAGLANFNSQQAPGAGASLVTDQAQAAPAPLSSTPQASPAPDAGLPLSMFPQANAAPAQPVVPVSSLPQVGDSSAPDPYADYKAARARAIYLNNNFPGSAQAVAALKAANDLKPKFSTEFRVAKGADGNLHNYLVSEDGSLKDAGVGVKPDMKSTDLGGQVVWNDANAITPGQTFAKTVTPGEALQSQDQAKTRAQQERHWQAEQAGKDDPKETQFMRELAAMYPKGSPEYDEALRQRINKEAGINAGGGGGRSVVYNGRIIASGNEVAQALRNIADLPVQSNAGFMGMGKPETSSLVSASIAGLKHSLNDDQIKTYNTMWTGVSRNLGTLETSGLATTGDLIKSIDKLQFVPGDNGYNALRKLAEVRQITEAALEPKLHDPAVPGQQREYIKGVIDAVHQAVPYTHADLTKYDRAAQKNPNLTFQDFAAQTVNKGKPAAVAPVANLPQKPAGLPADISGLLNKYGTR